MAKILSITDMDSDGSGYKNICTPLFSGLAKMGHDIKVCGLSYRGEEHNHPFSIIPTQTVEDAFGMVNNLVLMWRPDIILVALDIPLQIQLYSRIAPLLPRNEFEIKDGLTAPRKYIAITPLENGPLTMSWAVHLMNMDSVFFISELGKQEAIKAGVSKAEHLMVGVDTESWRPPTPEERTHLREGLGIPQDAFVVLTVGENQERKNLWAGMKAVSLLKDDIGKEKPIRYIIVTHKHSPFGWNLDDLAVSLGIVPEFLCYEKGMPQKDLWGLYAVADVYLQPSKAEGLGLPVMDAMACGVPVVATDTGAMTELLKYDRGVLVPSEYSFTDVWGNSKRDMIEVVGCSVDLKAISLHGGGAIPLGRMCEVALEYIKSRTWDIPCRQVDEKIKELLNEQKIP